MPKLFTALGYWCCGPSDTRAGKIARIMGVISTTLIFGGAISYFIDNFIMDGNRIECNKFPCSPFDFIASTLFFSGALGYIIAPIIGHKLCGYSPHLIDCELSGISVTSLPSYDEAVGIQNTRM